LNVGDLMNASEDISEAVSIVSDAPSTVSDAIENELRLRESGYPRTARSQFSCALRSVARLGGFIVRPESMTAYATVAAALAAFLAVRAAERQEKATFTSQLYSKQVDVLANAETTFLDFSTQVINHSADKDDKNDKDVSLAYDKAINALKAMHIVYPTETSEFFKTLESNLSTMSLRHLYVGDRPQTDMHLLMQTRDLYTAMYECAASQLSDGRVIDANQFNKCEVSKSPK
jgi:hypothetical protein